MAVKEQINISNIFITITTLIFAITSLITVFISLSAWQEERESVRPYLTFQNSPQVYFNEKKQLVFSFRFTNVGLHPAASLHSQIMVTECSLTNKPLHTEQFSLVNNIPQDSYTDLIVIIKNIDDDIIYNLDHHYLIINLKYFDPILSKNHEQIIYLRWSGVSNNTPNPIFHASKEDKILILDYLKKL